MTTNKQSNKQPQGLGFNPDEFRYFKVHRLYEKIKNILFSIEASPGSEKEALLGFLKLAHVQVYVIFFPQSEDNQVVFTDFMAPFFKGIPSEERAKASFLDMAVAIASYVLDSIKAFENEDKATAWRHATYVSVLAGAMHGNKNTSSSKLAIEIFSKMKTEYEETNAKLKEYEKAASERARKAANARHDKPNGSRKKQAKIREDMGIRQVFDPRPMRRARMRRFRLDISYYPQQIEGNARP